MTRGQPERDLSSPSYTVAVVMERRRKSGGRWSRDHWQALGIVMNDGKGASGAGGTLIRQDAEREQYLYRGFSLALHRDEAESYYYNLLSERPGVFIICREDPVDNRVVPVLTRISHYEAEAYLEAGDEVHAVPMPPEIYRWVERFVLDRYQPEIKKARKRENWHGQIHGAR